MTRIDRLGRIALAIPILALLPVPLAAQRGPRQAQPAATAVDPARYSQLKYRHIGPEGNRVSAVAGVPGDRRVYYAGAASGGIWKTSDAGISWQPVFDGQPVQSIGALAVAPSDPNVVWAGTGEPFIRSNISLGWGVYRSTDAGRTWTRAGLEASGRIGRIAVHPADPDVALVAALGHAYGPQPERGVYRTRDGGKTWERTLFVNDSTGAIDVIIDASNPRIAYAATWQLEIHTWGRVSGGAGSGIWKSTDGGGTWTRLTKGLPAKPFGKVGLGLSAGNPARVYALIETGDGNPVAGTEGERGELWRSDDAGESWQVVSYDRELAGRTQYYTRMAVAPDNENEAWFMSASATRTLDGGQTTVDLPPKQQPGFDHHDIWIDPRDAGRLAVGHDGGISISENRGASWLRVQLPIAQMYHVTTDNRVPYFVYGNRQDGPSARGPSNSKLFSWFGPGSVPRGVWEPVAGGESGWATPDPADSNLVWSSASGFGSVGGVVTRFDLRTKVAHHVEVWPEATIGHPAADLRYRFVWTFPLTISPHDPNRVYVGSQHVHVTTDGGRSWQELSPDLTRNDKTRQTVSGGLTPDNIGVEYVGVVFAIAESRLERGLIWAGTNDGKVHLSRDNGRTWTDLTANIPGLLPWGTISNIEPSRFDAGTAYLTVDGHQVDNRDPLVYKTTDYGRTWRLIVNGIAKSPLSFAHVVREDPARRGLLYLGTEGGLFVSFDDGERWQPLQNNLPHAPVHWLTVQEHFADLVVATYGRGFWILDDLTPLRALTPAVLAAEAELLAPRPAYRFKLAEPPFAPFDDPVAGQDPPYGASLHYWLRSESKDSVTIRILDASGKAVRTMKGGAAAGVNRIWWDLRGDQTKAVRLRTRPLYAPEVIVPDTGRAAPDVGRLAVMVAPGTYTVELTAGGKTYSRPLEVRKDPNSGGSLEEIRAQTDLLLAIRSDLEQAVDLIHTLEWSRSQLVSLRAVLARDSTAKDLVAGADSLERTLTGLEEHLVQLRLTGRGQDLIRWPMKLAAKLAYLAGGLETSDFAPTAQQREVAAKLRTELGAVRTRTREAITRDVAAFNERLRGRSVANIVVTAP
ncbi:MAG TPA: hypothetical protein VFN96_04075 [Gemmatimonadales bacterium]|nr:hypothetical protein [Gemmatimonadales bacterium]